MANSRSVESIVECEHDSVMVLHGELNTERINVRRGLDDMIWVGQE